MTGLTDKDDAGRNDRYTLSLRIQMFGDIRQDLLQKAFNTIIKRHDILRTIIHGGEEVTVDYSEPEFQQVSVQQDMLKDSINEFSDAVFDLSKGPLFRAILMVTDVQSHTMVVIFSHRVMDCYSALILGWEIMAVYRELLLGREATVITANTYENFIEREQKYLTNDRLKSLREHWVDRLRGCAQYDIPGPTSDLSMSDSVKYGDHILEYALGASLTSRVEDVCRDARATLFSGLLSVLQSAISQYSNQRKGMIFIPFSRRDPRLDEGATGPFVRTLPVCADIRDNMTYGDLLAEQFNRIFEAIEYSAVPEGMISEIISMETGLDTLPPAIVSQLIEQPDRVTDLPVDISITVRDGLAPGTSMVFSFIKSGNSIQCNLSFNKNLVDREVVQAIMNRFLGNLERLCEDTSQVISDFAG